MVNVDVRPLWFVGFLSAHFTLSLLVCLRCPFVPLPSLSLSMSVSCRIYFCNATRNGSERPVQARNMPHAHTVEQTCCVHVLDTVATRYADTFI